LILVGCGDPGRGPLKLQASKEVSEAVDPVVLETLRQENTELKRRIEVLAGIPAAAHGMQFQELQRAHLTRYTGLYDKDDDGIPEKLIVYVKPIDKQGDIVKSPATLEIQLWDLDASADRKLLRTWVVEPEVLREQWFATVVTINYRLVFDLPEGVDPQGGNLTVKMVFTALLSGQVFHDQMPVVPR
jgi:hypothetical protein